MLCSVPMESSIEECAVSPCAKKSKCAAVQFMHDTNSPTVLHISHAMSIVRNRYPAVCGITGALPLSW